LQNFTRSANSPLDNLQMPLTLTAACGAQSITAEDQRRCIRLCRAHGVDVGAAPDTIDRASLGMRVGIVDAESLAATVRRQVAAFDALRFVRLRASGEIVVDRAYESDGTLRGRSMPGALIDDFDACRQPMQSDASWRGFYAWSHAVKKQALPSSPPSTIDA